MTATIEELDAEIEALDRVEEATVTLLNLKPGDVLTESVIADLLFLDEYHRKEEETAIDTFHKGYQAGLQRAGGADTAKLIKERDAARTSVAVWAALAASYEYCAFRDGAQACREMLARVVENLPGPLPTPSFLAEGIRANWRPSWGADPGSPSENRYVQAMPCNMRRRAREYRESAKPDREQS